MAEAPLTRPSLLIRLRDFQDHEAWSQFVDVYGPLVYGYARKHGLQDADAADLTQACMRQVAAHVGSLEYDPRRGSFRGWLFTIVRNKLRTFLGQARYLYQGSGNSQMQRLLETQAAPEGVEAAEWERAYRVSLLAWASEQVRLIVKEATWQAFWQTAVEGKSGQEVARGLGLTPAAVYVAKSRVMARLRSFIHQVQESELQESE
jgi:RNA polymerase sigma factor (sigma-70 family)